MSSMYESAPDMLLDKLIEVNSLLEKICAKNGKTESFLFWQGVADVMKFAYAYMTDTRFIHERAQLTMAENVFLKKMVVEMENRLARFEVVRDLKIQGKFEETVAMVDEFLEKSANTLMRPPDKLQANE